MKLWYLDVEKKAQVVWSDVGASQLVGEAFLILNFHALFYKENWTTQKKQAESLN